MQKLIDLKSRINILNNKDFNQIKLIIDDLKNFIAQNFANSSSYIAEIDRIKFIPNSTFIITQIQEENEFWNNGKNKLLLILDRLMLEINTTKTKPIQLLTNIREETIENLIKLNTKISVPDENDFYKETIKCFEVGAWRASIIMMWNLTFNHLYDFTLTHKLTQYNKALTSKYNIKAKLVTKKEDFSEYKEVEIIEALKSAGVIDKNQRKILDEKLGTRNSYAHPSTLIITESKVVDYIEDLTINIIEKITI